MLRRGVFTAGLLLVTSSANGQTPAGNQSLFTLGDVALAGVFALSAYAIRPVDERLAGRLQDSSTQASRNLHRISTVVRTTVAPGAYYIGGGLYLAGRLGHDTRLQALGLHGTEGLVIGEVIAQSLKRVVGRQRPDVKPRDSHSYALFRGVQSDNFRSFPSGHSTAAFAAAAAVTSQTSSWSSSTKWIVGPVLFGGATVTAISRMYDNRHWASDVIAGAAVGTFAGLKIVRFHRLHPETGVDRLFITGRVEERADGSHAIQWGVLPASIIQRR